MTIFKTIKFWWRVKQYNRRLLKQAKEADRTPYETTKEDVDKWLKANPFELDRETLNSHCMEAAPKSRTVHIFKDIK